MNESPETTEAMDALAQARAIVMAGIVVEYVNPPIPTRDTDYCASLDGEPDGPRGVGRTTAEAVADLREQLR
jgi:hypothetical protein